jgi:hypothetical protein
MPFPAAAEDFTIVVLPDTQNYSDDNQETFFMDQTDWIVGNKDTLNIVYVAHVGDIVNTASSTAQYDNAIAAMSLLEVPSTGLPDGIPYGVVPGNHDSPTTNYNLAKYFGVSRYSSKGYYGGSYDSDNEDNYTMFSAGGIDAYYRLRRYHNTSFHIDPHGTSISSGTTDTGVIPDAGVWYNFKIQTEDMGSETEIKAKVWADDGITIEPDWQVICYDDNSSTRLTAGTIGVWSYHQGSKYWDDLAVGLIVP